MAGLGRPGSRAAALEMSEILELTPPPPCPSSCLVTPLSPKLQLREAAIGESHAAESATVDEAELGNEKVRNRYYVRSS